MTASGTERVCIGVSGIRKVFGDVVAVDGISFQVMYGELFGFLGPNGAGKTTTIHLLTGLARPDDGTIMVGGIDCSKNPKAAQHLIGVVPDESNLYPELSGFENLCFCGGLYGMSGQERHRRATELLEMFGLSSASQRKYASYSKGMKRRLTIAAGIMHHPPILFLDEPTTGIDVESARLTRGLLKKLHQEGTTIFLTTHYIEEAQRLCGRIAFLAEGRIIRTDTIDNLLSPVKGREIVEVAVSNPDTLPVDKLSLTFPGYSMQKTDDGKLLVESEGRVRIADLVRCLDELGAEVREARKKQLTLEDVFVSVTGIGADALMDGKGGKK